MSAFREWPASALLLSARVESRLKKQSCYFRDLKSEFAKVGASVVGVSADPWDRQQKFDQANKLGLMLLSDPDRRIAKQFGVKRPGSLPNRRKTFVLDVAGQVRHVISSETNMEKHADEALAMILSLTNPEEKNGQDRKP